jgi:hypothetical protein
MDRLYTSEFRPESAARLTREDIDCSLNRLVATSSEHDAMDASLNYELLVVDVFSNFYTRI